MEKSLLSKERIDFLSQSDVDIADVINRLGIGLSVSDVKRLQDEVLERAPTVTECQLWSIQGSEHCAYKSSKHLLKELPTKAPHLIIGVGEDAAVVSVARDNSGLRYGIAISHESHNHPSQIVPFEGAATGVGGNVRDVNCMGAEVIALADILRFGDFYDHKTRYINQEVVNGIASYGNALGIPNITGDVQYHESYQQNCLVNVVTLGIVSEDRVIHSYVPANADGYLLILVGKPTDNSGFGGASFASNTLNDSDANRGAVQEPNAFLERHLVKANLSLMKKFHEQGLLAQVAFKDLGAGGVGCASVEIADGNGFGAEVFLDEVHTSMEGLHPSVILCAETQERFMWAVPESLKEMVLTHYNKEFALPEVSYGAQARCVGRITSDKHYRVWFQGTKEVDALASDVTEGLTENRQIEAPTDKPVIASKHTQTDDLKNTALALLSHENIASDAAIYGQYDKQVQGRTIIERGRAQAGVLQPFNSDEYPEEIQQTGISLAVSQSPLKNLLNPYFGGMDAVLSAIEKNTAVGASSMAVTDCLCYGDPSIPTHMWAFKEGVMGIRDACQAYTIYDESDVKIPVVGGNVSFYNTSSDSAIAPSPIVSVLAKMPDVSCAVDFSLKQPGENLMLVRGEALTLAGSVYQSLYPCDGEFQTVALEHFEKRNHFILEAISKSLISSSYAINVGGVFCAIAKMMLGGHVGVGLKLPPCSEDDSRLVLFAETGGFVISVSEANYDALLTLAQQFEQLPVSIGQTKEANTLTINDTVSFSRDELEKAYLNTLKKALL